jgi:hypothetical protein
MRHAARPPKVYSAGTSFGLELALLPYLFSNTTRITKEVYSFTNYTQFVAEEN